jgi:hypothetical protein
VEVGAQYGPVSASVSTGYEASTSLKNFVASTTESTYEDAGKEETKVKEEFNIGPGDKLYFYQHVFSGPGMEFNLDTKSVVSQKKTAQDDTEIYIDVLTKPIRFIESLDVVYGSQPSDAPNDRIREHSSKSDNINDELSLFDK